MACQCAPALRRLQQEINAKWPDRDKASDGCCGDAAHAARKSEHNPTDGYAHALDIDENLTPTLGSLEFLVPILLADSRTKYVIYEGRIHYPPGTSKPYTGVNAHKQHLHLSIKSTATFETRSWLTGTPAPQEDEMTPEQIDALTDGIAKKVLNALRTEGVSGAADANASTVDDKVVQALEPRLKAIEEKLASLGGSGASGTVKVTGTLELG